MMAEFVDHPLPVDLHLCRMMQDVKPDEARQKIVEFHRSNSRFRSRYRSTLSGTDIEAKRFSESSHTQENDNGILLRSKPSKSWVA